MLKEAMTPENKVEVVKGALEDETTLKALIDQTLKKFKKIDVLVRKLVQSGPCTGTFKEVSLLSTS